MALTQDSIISEMEGIFAEFPVAATTKIYEGALVMLNASGFAVNLSGAGQKFAGVADRQADNSAGANGDIRVKCRVDEHAIEIPVTGAVQGSAGLPVYASDENTLTITGATANQIIGKIIHFVTGTTCQVLLLPFLRVALAQADSAAAPTQAEFNALLAKLRAAGLMAVP